MDWQPIETAPKGETDILICKVYDDGSVSHIEIAHQYDDEPGEWYGLQDICLSEPTHWMPLPDPPSA